MAATPLRNRLRDISTPVRLMTNYSHKKIAGSSHTAVQYHLPVALAQVRLAPTEREGRANYDLATCTLALINYKFTFFSPVASASGSTFMVRNTPPMMAPNTGAETAPLYIYPPACGSLMTTTSAKRDCLQAQRLRYRQCIC